MCNILITESDVTSSMMGEMYRQLASAQIRGRLYKTGYRRTKASPREVQIGTTSQNTAITTRCGVSAIAAGTPAAPVPGMSQFDKWGFGFLIGWFVGGTSCTLQTLYAWLMRGFGIGMVGILIYRVLHLSLRCDSWYACYVINLVT